MKRGTWWVERATGLDGGDWEEWEIMTRDGDGEICLGEAYTLEAAKFMAYAPELLAALRRLCDDYAQLNNVSERDSYALRDARTLIGRVEEAVSGLA